MASGNYVEKMKANPVATATIVLLLALVFMGYRISDKLDTITPCVCPGMAQPPSQQ